MTWHPIDSTEHPAPRDGTEIIVLGYIKREWGEYEDKPRACISAYHEKAEDSPAYGKGWYYSAPGFGTTIKPVLWSPLPVLPPPPKDEG